MDLLKRLEDAMEESILALSLCPYTSPSRVTISSCTTDGLQVASLQWPQWVCNPLEALAGCVRPT